MALGQEWRLRQVGSLLQEGELKEEKPYQLKFRWLSLKV
tara:strand:- start:8 stop:124 length:117 start_codon:yes stop_codon:yes gene_type:complete